MNETLNEMKAILDDDEEALAHIGMPRRSGRYPWGSGKDPYQHTRDFLSRIEEAKAEGFSETPEEIRERFGMTSTEYRAQKALSKDLRRMDLVARARSLAKDGLGPSEIARKMGLKNESVARGYLTDTAADERARKAVKTADFIRKRIDEVGMVDVGRGTEIELNISREKFQQALTLLQAEGYPLYKGGIPQATNPSVQINQMVICPKGTPHKDIYNYDQVHSLKEYITRDGGETFEKKFHYPESLDPSRIKIRYAEEGGTERDGMIQLKRGVDDISLGDALYSQVRIMVNGTHYLKGMAVYADDSEFPPGVDVIFNTNKHVGKPMIDTESPGRDKCVLKPLKPDPNNPSQPDPENPFGSAIKDSELGGQLWYTDKKTGERKLGVVNKRADEGDWSDWKDALPSQFLSKQSQELAKKQLNLAKVDKESEFEEICSVNNPTVKKALLKKFADECDSAAVELKAAALPGQKYHVILSDSNVKETEIYAPRYEDGTKLALVRYPHGGTFEIPIVTVNNKIKSSQDMIGKTPSDAVCINSKVAERLSGADFDGDTVMCIPTHDRRGRVKIANSDPLEELKDFDPKESYPERPGMVRMSEKNKGLEMGRVTNLITDMTLLGASREELAQAVKHSMVVIDAYKHKLDYKRSEKDCNIEALRAKWQIHRDENGDVYKVGGATTLISSAKSPYNVPKRQGTPKYNMKYLKDGTLNPDFDPKRPEGALVFKDADDAYYEKVHVNKRTGEVKVTQETRWKKSTKMYEADDARDLISAYKHPMEEIYADFANTMKALANKARKTEYNTPNLKYDPAAKKAYADDVNSLLAKLNTALLNAPRERQAQRMTATTVKAKEEKYKEAGMEFKKDDKRKASQKALTKYREEVQGVSRRGRNVKITESEWAAIQAGAITESKLNKIIANADIKILRQMATPRTTSTITPAKLSQIKALQNSNYTLAQIADRLGVSPSTVSKALKGGN